MLLHNHQVGEESHSHPLKITSPVFNQETVHISEEEHLGLDKSHGKHPRVPAEYSLGEITM